MCRHIVPPQGEAKPRERVTSLLFHLGGVGNSTATCWLKQWMLI